MAGVAALFTREFFVAARARLKPDGVLCQWAHTYDISPTICSRSSRTFASVFPQGTMWLVGEGDLLLIGTTGDGDGRSARSDGGGREEWATARTRWRRSASRTSSAAFDLLSLFAGGPRELERYGAGALIQTDDRTALEYSAPRGIYGRTTTENARRSARSAANCRRAVGPPSNGGPTRTGPRAAGWSSSAEALRPGLRRVPPRDRR